MIFLLLYLKKWLNFVVVNILFALKTIWVQCLWNYAFPLIRWGWAMKSYSNAHANEVRLVQLLGSRMECLLLGADWFQWIGSTLKVSGFKADRGGIYRLMLPIDANLTTKKNKTNSADLTRLNRIFLIFFVFEDFSEYIALPSPSKAGLHFIPLICYRSTMYY